MPSVQLKQEKIEQKCNCKSSDCASKRCGCVKNESRCQSFCGCDKTLCKNQDIKTKSAGNKNQIRTSRGRSKASVRRVRSKSMELASGSIKVKDEMRVKERPEGHRKLFQQLDDTVDVGSGDDSQLVLESKSNTLAKPKSSAKSRSLTTTKSDIRSFFEFFQNLVINEKENLHGPSKRQSPSLS